MDHHYSGKTFSILGDSISTLEGYNPEKFPVFYYTRCYDVQAGVKTIMDTWWGKVINYFEGRFLVNNSWAKSRVTPFDMDMKRCFRKLERIIRTVRFGAVHWEEEIYLRGYHFNILICIQAHMQGGSLRNTIVRFGMQHGKISVD